MNAEKSILVEKTPTTSRRKVTKTSAQSGGSRIPHTRSHSTGKHVTITTSGGTEGDSHDIRIINSGAANIGFSTNFLWPSGAAPNLPTADGTISLISFTVNQVGAGTQLLSGASLNYS